MVSNESENQPKDPQRRKFLKLLGGTLGVAFGLTKIDAQAQEEILYPNLEILAAFLDEFIDFYLEISPMDISGRISLERDIIEIKARKKK